ncbi:trypanothione synthetase/amidase [Strigomonas culicis]|uniref:Trypanothione synthetase/amidase n=1 Tax=Strigomonas culicis TaxID=28005 RepID=S9V7U8_9TRYP|nr:trypanothione synthetase/amidase [Strigomonas culicis]|eukprot:EPY37109.1 trypanothione synthetase/amidase [Strigomonas culicis]
MERDLDLNEIERRLESKREYEKTHADHHYETHHRGRDMVPFGGVVGITRDGVPVMSNGSELGFSKEHAAVPASRPLCTFQEPCPTRVPFKSCGYKWQCVEYVRRYLAARKAVWLASIPTAEDMWTQEDCLFASPTQKPVSFTRVAHGVGTALPEVGSVLVWSRNEETPFGHVAIITEVGASWVRIAEQNQGFEVWPDSALFSREIPMRAKEDGTVELIDEDPILGWIIVNEQLYDYNTGDIGDAFRIICGRGRIVRQTFERQPTLPWINVAERCDLYLKRSLTHDGDTSENGVAAETDVPGAFYFLDYDMFCRMGRAANSLHALAMEATRKVLDDPDSEHLLEYYFGVPREIQPLLRHSWELTPPMGGRFDFGFDGEKVVMLEYNCDSSGALLECCDTQGKMAKWYNIHQGDSAGSFLGAKCVAFFQQLLQNEKACPTHHLCHFMIDDDDEEHYTALCMMNFAERAGFRCKLCVRLGDFHYKEGCHSPVHKAPETLPCDHPTILDADGEEVLLVWKTWSWDTVLHQYVQQKASDGPGPEAPTLSDILLNNHVRVLEPLWKAVTGSKAVLPFMYALAPDHENMLPASFQQTQEILSTHHISKPVNGRAGQNIVMHDPCTSAEQVSEAPRNEDVVNSFAMRDSFTGSFAAIDRENESSPGRFFDSVVVYQQRLFLKKFDKKYFPIFCGWVVGDEFSGIVVREDTSKITKLSSVVIPARVVRANEPLPHGEEQA